MHCDVGVGLGVMVMVLCAHLCRRRHFRLYNLIFTLRTGYSVKSLARGGLCVGLAGCHVHRLLCTIDES